MRRVLLLVCLLVVFRCAAPPPPVAAPEATPPPLPAPVEEKPLGKVTVTASALNVRETASTDSAVLTQVRRGTMLDVLESGESWTKVRLADGSSGWVASRFVAEPGAKSSRAATSRRGGCPPDSDYAFLETPTPRFSDSGAHGLVVVDATVNASGVVTATKVVSNSTGDEALAFLTEKEIRSAKFSPPIRNCVPKPFIFTYRRTF